MFGGSFQITRFDSSSKWQWLGADITTFSYLATPMGLAIGLVIAITGAWIEVTIAPPVFLALEIVPSTLFGFIVVFCRRWNPFVLGGQREFRYLCRWL